MFHPSVSRAVALDQQVARVRDAQRRRDASAVSGRRRSSAREDW